MIERWEPLQAPCVYTLTPGFMVAARALLGWTRGRLSRMADVTYDAVKEYEHGSSRTRVNTRTKIAEALRAVGVIMASDGAPMMRRTIEERATIMSDLGEWHSMDSAPSDGTLVDLMDADGAVVLKCRWELCDVEDASAPDQDDGRYAWSGFWANSQPVSWRLARKGN